MRGVPSGGWGLGGVLALTLALFFYLSISSFFFILSFGSFLSFSSFFFLSLFSFLVTAGFLRYFFYVFLRFVDKLLSKLLTEN